MIQNLIKNFIIITLFSLLPNFSIQSADLDKQLLNTFNLQQNEQNLINSIEKLINEGANINAKSESGDTPLMIAANEGFEKTVKFLVDKGANVNAQNEDGSTVLMEALNVNPFIERYANRKNIVNILLENGANVTLKNKDDETAYDIAEPDDDNVATLIKQYDDKYQEYLKKWREESIQQIIEKRKVPRDVAIEIINRVIPPTYIRWFKYLRHKLPVQKN